jgi:hypothetical protein
VFLFDGKWGVVFILYPFFMQQCRRCKEFKELDEFLNRRDRRNGKDTICRICHREASYQQKLKLNPDYKPKTPKEARDNRFETEEEIKNELLTILGYDLAGELSVYEQFLNRHNLVD